MPASASNDGTAKSSTSAGELACGGRVAFSRPQPTGNALASQVDAVACRFEIAA